MNKQEVGGVDVCCNLKVILRRRAGQCGSGLYAPTATTFQATILGHNILGNSERRFWTICHLLATVSLRLFGALGLQLHGRKSLLGSFGEHGIVADISTLSGLIGPLCRHQK